MNDYTKAGGIMKTRIVGIDLAGSENRDTGYCLLECSDKRLGFNINKIKVLHTDNEILSEIKKDNPQLVAVDAPLSLPFGRKDINSRDDNHFRQCDLMLRKKKIRFFPITLGPMRKLTARGIKLKEMIKRMKIKVIEVFPGASYDILKIPRKDRDKIKSFFNLSGEFTQDELDAVMCAYTGYLYTKGKAEELKGIDGCIVIAKLND